MHQILEFSLHGTFHVIGHRICIASLNALNKNGLKYCRFQHKSSDQMIELVGVAQIGLLVDLNGDHSHGYKF